MAILVCPLSRVPHIVGLRKPSRVVSLLDPHAAFPKAQGLPDTHHLKVKIHDIADPEEGFIAPSARHVKDIVAFVSAWDRQDPILIHCWAGISRSTATAFVTACLHNPSTDEEEIAWSLRRASASATPNPRLVALADAEMGRAGRMIKAAAAIGRGNPTWPAIEEAIPFEIPSRFETAA